MIRTLITRMIARYTARREYWAASDEATRAWTSFTEPDGTTVTRWEALSWAANCERTMADTASGFADTYEEDFGGRTLEQAHRLAAELLELMADTELAPMPTELGCPAWPWRSHIADAPTVSAVLTRLARETDMGGKAELTLALHAAVVPMVGDQVAEVLAWIARGYTVLAGLDRAGGDR